jgi:putative hydrolase of the HAD superfamily
MMQPASPLSSILPYIEQHKESIDGVIFDAVGTLIHPAQPIASTYHAHGHRFGSQLQHAEIAERFRRAFHKATWQPATNEHHRASWRGIVAEVFQDVADARDIEMLFDALWWHFSRPSAWSVPAEVGGLLQNLQARRIRLAIASNFDDRLLGICAEFPELAPCSPILTATMLGTAKPAPEFFDAVATRMELEPARLLMIGDDAELDVAAARAAGWQAIGV